MIRRVIAGQLDAITTAWGAFSVACRQVLAAAEADLLVALAALSGEVV